MQARARCPQYPRRQVVAVPEADALGGEHPDTAVVLQGERPQCVRADLARRRRIRLPHLKRGPALQRPRVVGGVPPGHPVQQAGGKVLEVQEHLVLRPRPAPARARLTYVAGQRGQEHRLNGPVQALHRALEVRGVGGQVLHLHGQGVERGDHRPRQEVLAPVHAYLLREPALRPERLLAHHGRPERGQDRLPRRMPRGDRHTHDRVRRAVHEPGDPRPTRSALDVDQDRGLDVIGLPHLVPPAPRPGQEHIMLAGLTLTTGKPRPLPRRQITPDRTVQRRNRRRRITLAPGRTGGQLTVDSGDVPLPQP